MGSFTKILSCLFSPSITNGEMYEQPVFGVMTPTRSGNNRQGSNTNQRTTTPISPLLRSADDIDKDIQAAQNSITDLKSKLRTLSETYGEDVSKLHPTVRSKLSNYINQIAAHEQGLKLLSAEYDNATTLPLRVQNVHRVITSHQITQLSNKIMKNKLSEIDIDQVDDALIEQEQLNDSTSKLIGASTYISDESQRKLEIDFHRILDDTSDVVTELPDPIRDIRELNQYTENRQNTFSQTVNTKSGTSSPGPHISTTDHNTPFSNYNGRESKSYELPSHNPSSQQPVLSSTIDIDSTKRKKNRKQRKIAPLTH